MQSHPETKTEPRREPAAWLSWPRAELPTARGCVHGGPPPLTAWGLLSFPLKSSPLPPSSKLLSNRRQTGCILLRKGVINCDLYQQANKRCTGVSTFVQRRVKVGFDTHQGVSWELVGVLFLCL